MSGSMCATHSTVTVRYGIQPNFHYSPETHRVGEGEKRRLGEKMSNHIAKNIGKSIRVGPR